MSNESIENTGLSETNPSYNEEELISVLQNIVTAYNNQNMDVLSSIFSANQTNIMRTFNSALDDTIIPDKDNQGLTFFTRPQLNMQSGNLMMHETLSMFNTTVPTSVQGAIRAYLDKNIILDGVSPLYEPRNPFIPILSNKLKTLSGFPDMVLETFTSPGGFFNEDYTVVKGWDEFNKTQSLTATFSDVRGGFITALLFVWMLWVHLVIKGICIPYNRFIEERLICYSFSIYRFIMDESNRHITKWAKATGCIWESNPLGAYFNYDRNAGHITASANLSFPIKVGGRIEYFRPIVLQEFNMLIDKFNGGDFLGQGYTEVDVFRGSINNKNMVSLTEQGITGSYSLIPYIDLLSGYNELKWYILPS